MNHTTDTGGSAYPQTLHPGSGMTLLDYFAGQALTGLMANQPMLRILVDATETDVAAGELVARTCYDNAESMIAEKRRREGGVK